MITCERTGRTWPDEKRTDLKKCTLCKGLIDIRHESWKGDMHGNRPEHGGECPRPQEQAIQTTQAAVQAQKPKLSGRELLERNEWYKKNILDKEQK